MHGRRVRGASVHGSDPDHHQWRAAHLPPWRSLLFVCAGAARSRHSLPSVVVRVCKRLSWLGSQPGLVVDCCCRGRSVGNGEILLLNSYRASTSMRLITRAHEWAHLPQDYSIPRGAEWMHCTGGDSVPAGAEISTTEQHTRDYCL